MLNGASLLGSKLQGAQFGCAERGTNTETDDGEAGGDGGLLMVALGYKTQTSA